MGKELKPKVRMFLRLIPTFADITGEKLVGGAFLRPPPLSQNRVKILYSPGDKIISVITSPQLAVKKPSSLVSLIESEY